MPTDPDLLDITTEFRIAGTPWFLDARLPRERAIISHAHSDHLGRHAKVIATPITCDLISHRLAEPGEPTTSPPPQEDPTPTRIPTEYVPLPYGEPHHDGPTTIDLFPAGHVLGSAMARITTPRGRLLYTGDFRWKPDALTVPRCSPPTDGADTVLMECTYGLPRYRFPDRASVLAQLCDLIAAAQAEGKQPICLCYSLGKAQEIARVLTDNGFGVCMHGAAYAITEIYHRNGVPTGDVCPYEPGKIANRVLIAPPHIRNSRMITNIKNSEIIVITGWALDTSAKYRYQAQHALPISDHADFGELNAFVDAMRDRGAKRFLLTHGFVKEFCRHLRSRGIDAGPARPPPQLSLFDD
ncbi:MAG: MBL fold metallo-hydrolase [Phycisphaerae bacterium]